MSLHEFRAEIPYEAAAAADELLLERQDERWSVLEDVIDRRAWIIGIFESEDEARRAWREMASAFAPVGEPVVRALADTDWRDSYKLHFKAWQCGRLHWVPVWEREGYALPEGDVALWLDPGLAFGTGNHETTRLCCERLVAWAGQVAPSARVVDAGCGSGILALSAARLGMRDVRGFDNDPEAVRVSRENAQLNQLDGKVSFFVGDLVSGLSGVQADLLLANIQADVLQRFVEPLVLAVAPGGTLAMSGILAREVEAVRVTFARYTPGWAVESRQLGEWCDVALTRP